MNKSRKVTDSQLLAEHNAKIQRLEKTLRTLINWFAHELGQRNTIELLDMLNSEERSDEE